MAVLRLFGLRLPLAAGDVGEPVASGVEVAHWSTVLNPATGALTLRAWLHLEGEFTLAVQLLLSAVADSSGDWALRDGPQPQGIALTLTPVFRLLRGGKTLHPYPGTLNPGTSPPIAFQAGPYLAERSSFVSSSVFGDNGLQLSLGATVPVLSGPDLPFSIRGGAGGMRLDLAALAVDLGVGFLGCETRATLAIQNPPLNAEFFKRRWTSAATRLVLRDGGYTSEVVFRPLAWGQALPMSVDLLDRSAPPTAENPVLAAQTLAGNLRLICTRSSPAPIRLDQAWIEPLQGGTVELTANFLAQPGGAASRWAINGRVPLHLRVGSVGRPSTFVIAPIPNGLAATVASPSSPLHGPITAAEFQLSGDARLRCEDRVVQAVVGPHVNPSIASENTAPFLTEERTGRVVHAKPGRTYRSLGAGGAQADVVTLGFSGAGLGVPLTPDSQLAVYPQLRTDAYARLDALAQSLGPIPLQQAVHETLLLEASPPGHPQTLRVRQLYGGAVPTFLTGRTTSDGTALRLEAHRVKRSYGGIEVEHPVDPQTSLDYVLLFENDVHVGGTFDFPPAPALKEVVLAGRLPNGVGNGTNKLLGLLKLSTAHSLGSILAAEAAHIAQKAGAWDWQAFLKTTLKDDALKSKGWLGMLLFETPIDISKFTVLNSMVPNCLRLSYLAVTPQKDGQSGKTPFSVSARVRLDVPATTPATWAEGEEVRFRLQLLDMVWKDSSLSTFRTEATLGIRSIFGAPHPDPQPDVRIVGSYDGPTNTFRFLGELPYEQPIFPEETTFGPINQVYVRSAEIVASNDVARLHLDGRIKTQPFTMAGMDWFDGASSPDLSFRGLGLVLPDALNLDWRWLRIDYPSLRLNIDGPQFRLLNILNLKMVGVGVDWPNIDVPHVPWGELFEVWKGPNFDVHLPAFNVKLRLDLMRLPELVARSLERLRFDFTLGFNLDPWEEARFRVALTSVDFARLDLELMRFLTVKAEGVHLYGYDINVGQGPQKVPRFDFKQVSIAILDYQLIDKLDLVLYSLPDGRTCFVSRITNPADLGWLKIHWVLIGQNMNIPQRLAKDLLLLAIEPASDNSALANAINDVWTNGGGHNGFLPVAPGSGRGEWIFGAGFDLFHGFVVGKFLFQDHAYYGIALDGAWLEQWFGWNFAISVLYIVGDRPEEDRFVVSLRMPSVTLPAFHFFGGVVTVEIDMRGRFLLDIGFPWMRPNGSRLWDRMFGAIVTPFQGTGGAYIANGLTRTDLPGDVLVLAGGVAVQFGFGGAFGGGAFRVWATAGIYFVAEGEFYFRSQKRSQELIGVFLAGSAGILVRAGGELNWWVISVRVELTVSAECRLVATWGWQPGDPLPVLASARSRRTAPVRPGDGARRGAGRLAVRDGITVRVSFILYAHASASACIGGGWFKVCKGISVTIPLRYDCQLTMA